MIKDLREAAKELDRLRRSISDEALSMLPSWVKELLVLISEVLSDERRRKK